MYNQLNVYIQCVRFKSTLSILVKDCEYSVFKHTHTQPQQQNDDNGPRGGGGGGQGGQREGGWGNQSKPATTTSATVTA